LRYVLPDEMVWHGPTEDAEEALVAFFRALPADARDEYARLAELDREFGEDVAAEERARQGQGLRDP
jgi:hypothetical protein